MTNNHVLVVDDEEDIRELFILTLQRMGLSCDTAALLSEGIQLIDKKNYDLVLTDMRLPDGDGIELVRHVQKTKPHIPIAVITAYGNIESAVNTLKAGAFDYVSKPINLDMLKRLVSTAIGMQPFESFVVDESLVGDSLVIGQLRQSIQKLARSQAPVFIFGASGVGKELVAQLIHTQGPRKEKPFIAVNCGAIPGELMESEFFGHKKGSFTGAIKDKAGLFVAAHGGTLFLDEIAELPLTMQVKLLRAIQERAIKPIGDVYEIPVDVRILSASNKNLSDEIKSGHFRQDLYYRVNVIELYVPSLSEHASDIPILAQNILKKLTHLQNRPEVTLQPDCMSLLQSYHFPGNVRELENILERALVLSDGEVVGISDIQLPQSSNMPSIVPPHETAGLQGILEDQEKTLILNALAKTKWNRTAAAELLGISFRTLRYRLKKLGLDRLS
jgi:two-component system, NtrC family, response regulator PilR